MVFRKAITMAIAFLMVFAITTTAFASTYVDYATWNSTVCLYGFTTSHSTDKGSGETWDFVIVYADKVEFASGTGDAFFMGYTQDFIWLYNGEHRILQSVRLACNCY
jgi:hypothetical protein